MTSGQFGVVSGLFAGFMLIGVFSCGRWGFQKSSGERQNEEQAASPLLTVEALFSKNGANWNDWVAYDRASPIQTQPDVPCLATHRGYQNCLHGGEFRKILLPGMTDCEDVTAHDALGYFRWICVLIDGQAAVISVSLKEDIRLSQLVVPQENVFRRNRVTINIEGATLQTPLAAWWSNPIAPLPTGGGTLDSIAGVIYHVDSSRSTPAIRFGASGQALIMPEDVSLTWDGNGVAACRDAETCLVQSSGFDFSWIEGTFDGADIADISVYLAEGRRLTLRHVDARRTRVNVVSSAAGAVSLDRVRDSRIRNLRIFESGGSGLYPRDASENLFDDIAIAQGRGVYGLTLSAQNNVFHNFRISNGPHESIWQRGTSRLNTYSSTLIAGYTNGPFIGRGSATLHHITVANIDSSADGNRSFRLNSAGYSVSNVLVFNTEDSGFRINSNAQLAHLAAAASSRLGFEFAGGDTSQNIFSGHLLLGEHTLGNCGGPSTSPTRGLSDSCANQGENTATLQLVTDLASAFVGPVTNDAENPADNQGPILGSLITATGASQFENSFRLWGVAASTFDNSTRRQCSDNITCQIWDFRLAQQDQRLRGIHGTASLGAPCPDSVHGAANGTGRVLRDIHEVEIGGDEICDSGDACTPQPNVFLANAIEILHDFIGDDDSLCESHEACVFAPNIGAYQGEGDFSNHRCLFQDGPDVLGVTMYFYPVNGG